MTDQAPQPSKLGYSKMTVATPLGVALAEGIIATADQYLPHSLTWQAEHGIILVCIMTLVWIVPHDTLSRTSEAIGSLFSRLTTKGT